MAETLVTNNISKKPALYVNATLKAQLDQLKEQFKTKDPQPENQDKTSSQLPIDFKDKVGEEHPFDYEAVDKLLTKFALVNAVVEKIVDFSLGPDYTIRSEDERVIKITDKFHKETQFKSYLRGAKKDNISKGCGYLEIAGLGDKSKKNTVKVVTPNTMYVKKDVYGNIIGFTQFIGSNTSRPREEEIIPLKTNEIVQFCHNKIGTCAYGYGIVYPAMQAIDNFLMVQKSIHALTARKANVPIHVKIGNEEKDDYPSEDDINSFGQLLQYMNEQTEWVTGPNVEMKPIDFGNIGDKFESILANDYKLLSYGFQVPESIMGSDEASGLGEAGKANVQVDGFNRRIKAIQQEDSLVLRNQVYDRVLASQGIIDADYEIVWNQVNEEEVNNKLQKLQSLLSVVSEEAKPSIERKIFELIEIDYDEVEQAREDKKETQDEAGETEFDRQMKLTKVKMQKKKESITQEFIRKVGSEYCVFSHQTGKKFGCYKSKAEAEKRLAQIHAFSKDSVVLTIRESMYTKPNHIHEAIVTENIPVHKWLNIDIAPFREKVLQSLETDSFKNLNALNESEVQAGYLTTEETEVLREIFRKNISENRGILDIKRDIYAKLNIKDLENITAEQRIDMIAKTELTRLLNVGIRKSMEAQGEQLVKWDATIDEATCPICQELNNKVFVWEDLSYDESPPIHPHCRCSLAFLKTKEKVSDILKENLAPQEIELRLGQITKLPQEKITKFLRTYEKLKESNQ